MAGAATVLIQLSPLHILLDSVKCTFTVIMPCINQRPLRTGKDMQKKRLKPGRRETRRDWSDRLSSGQESYEHEFVQETWVFNAATPPGDECKVDWRVVECAGTSSLELSNTHTHLLVEQKWCTGNRATCAVKHHF